MSNISNSARLQSRRDGGTVEFGKLRLTEFAPFLWNSQNHEAKGLERHPPAEGKTWDESGTGATW